MGLLVAIAGEHVLRKELGEALFTANSTRDNPNGCRYEMLMTS